MISSSAILSIKNKLLMLLGTLLLVLVFNRGASAQSAQLDVDRLYQKYKGTTETTIFVGDKEINARVLINYNTSNHPYRIIVYGETVADSDMEDLVAGLGEAKVKAGYKKMPRNSVVNFDQNGIYENNIEVVVYQKGTQYAKYGIKKMETRNQLVPEGGDARFRGDFFYFEVGDTARKRNSKPEKFDF